MIKRILLLVIVIGGGMTTVAQNSIDTLFVSVSQRLSGHPSELIYLQTGKDIYETGEDLWFKAYQLDAKYNRQIKSGIFSKRLVQKNIIYMPEVNE